jgi:hypothetical protein
MIAVQSTPLLKMPSNLTDRQTESWIEKYIARNLTSDPQCQLLLEERARRQSKVLKIEKSLQHLMLMACRRTFTTYGDLAEASGVPWNKARPLMNGPRGHLDRLVEICYVRDPPLLTALCVNQQGADTGDLSDGVKRVHQRRQALRVLCGRADDRWRLRSSGLNVDCLQYGHGKGDSEPLYYLIHGRVQ